MECLVDGDEEKRRGDGVEGRKKENVQSELNDATCVPRYQGEKEDDISWGKYNINEAIYL